MEKDTLQKLIDAATAADDNHKTVTEKAQFPLNAREALYAWAAHYNESVRSDPALARLDHRAEVGPNGIRFITKKVR